MSGVSRDIRGSLHAEDLLVGEVGAALALDRAAVLGDHLAMSAIEGNPDNICSGLRFSRFGPERTSMVPGHAGWESKMI
jgi:hypothetical protein